MGTKQPNYEYTGDIVRQHLREIGQHPLLTREQEVELGRTYKRGVIAADTLAEITDPSNETELSHEEYADQALVAQIGHFVVRKGEAAKEKLVVSNLRLTVSIAKRYQNNGVDLIDLVQEGHIGLHRAVEKFDPEKGFKFSTYATGWVKQAVTRAIADKGSTIRTPVHMYENLSKMRRLEREIESKLGYVDDATVCEALEIHQKKLEEWRMYDQRSKPASLNATIGDEGSKELGDMVADKDSDVDYRKSEQQNIFEEFWDKVEAGILDEREMDVIIHRFGLFGVEPCTLEEVGERYSLTRERIRQIEYNALKKMRVANFSFSVPDYAS